MTSPGGRIEIRVDPDLRGFSTRLASGLSSAAGRGVAAFASAASTALVYAGGAAAVALGAGIAKGLSTASFTEQAEISFETLLGSAQRAREYMEDLPQFAATTPFELPGVVASARQLLGVGQAAETVIPTLTAWGDTAGALGLTQEQFSRVMTASTQAMAKGKVQAEELMQITEAGIPIYALLSKALGLPVSEIQKLASEGKLLAEDVFPALERQMQADYGGAMARQAQTLSGVWSTAKDNINLALRDAVLPLASALRTTIPEGSERAAVAIRTMGLRGSEGLLWLIERGQQLRQQFGPELGELGEAAAEKWGTFLDLLDELGSEVAPSIPALVDSLLRIVAVGGEVTEELLPALRAGLQLAGPAAEFVAGALGVVADVLETISPILPAVVGGFLAFRGVSAVVGIVRGLAGPLGTAARAMQTFAVQAQYTTIAMTGSVTAGQRVGGVISGLARATPLLAVATLGLGVALSKAEADQQRFAAAAENAYDKLRQGGSAADQARAELALLEEAASKVGNGFGTFGSDLQGELDRVRAQVQRTSEAMTPLQRAQEQVTIATNNLQLAQERYGPTSEQAATASRNLRTAQENLERKQRDLDNATRSATSALLEQTQAALASANADLAASMANTQLSQAMTSYNEALAAATPGTVEHQAAQDSMTQSALSAAQALAEQAFAHSTAATDELKQLDADRALLASLQQTAQQLGSNTPAAITNLIASLQASAGAGASTSAAMQDLGLSVVRIPNSKTVIINAPTAEQKQRLMELGYTVNTLPNGDVEVIAHTADAERAINYVTRPRTVVATVAQRGSIRSIEGGERRARGGYISGPGTWTSDSIPAWLSNGEYVVRAASTAKARSGLEAANRGDWAAAAREFTALAERQSRAVLGAAVARQAGHYAAGGYVDQMVRQQAAAGRSGGAASALPPIQMDVYPSRGMDEIGLADRAVHQLEIMARTR